MANYTIKHECGHEANHNIGGPVRNRDSRREWLESQLCRDCYIVERDRRNAEADTASAAANAEAGLPELTGTPKQIAWAESIRADRIADIETMELDTAQALADGRLAADNPNYLAYRSAIAEIKAQGAARWWIDGRSQTTRQIAAEIIKEGSR